MHWGDRKGQGGTAAHVLYLRGRVRRRIRGGLMCDRQDPVGKAFRKVLDIPLVIVFACIVQKI